MALQATTPLLSMVMIRNSSESSMQESALSPALGHVSRLTKRCQIEAVIALMAGLDQPEFARILAACDLPTDQSIRSLDPRSFKPVDFELDPELRSTILALAAFQALTEVVAASPSLEVALDRFLAPREQGGWQLPATLRLADYGLGHDDRARHPQPVASRLAELYPEPPIDPDAYSPATLRLHAANLALPLPKNPSLAQASPQHTP
jgi:hypothetical protein